ncbi:hypothetical protein HELRODRAFT_75856 [Helobdella robusta]|uniref:[histone H3]-trimethyl-L-lysine(4) demethylase n=1 Tax=Helobdella robusta TaxID=6412 RepID=T1G2B3_HELRO|nr:hypothetical protein HELRODRAFT_75856 [Helobdella robusta]ESO07518.1 hypothetical protein HELRODRAFT_75856 [Helobdella robusta]
MDPDKKFDFVRPPECPVFEPDAEEFSNFEEYIEKIKPLAVQYGLCRIKSPPSWKPPFVADPHKFKFTPRVQRLNEIEANTRVKWMFMSNLDKFWSLQGFKFKNPTIDGKYLDFFKLKKTVDEVGGFETICTKNLWIVVAKKLELSGKKAPSLLKSHYEKYLYPYDIFQAGIHNQVFYYLFSLTIASQSCLKYFFCLLSFKLIFTQTLFELCKSSAAKQDKFHLISDFGNGLKHSLAEEDKTNEDDIPRKRNKVILFLLIQLNFYKSQNSRSQNKDYKCQSCERGDDDDVLLLCDGCDEAYHTFCLIPPLSKIPPGDWLCPRCVAKECNQSPATYGFEQADLEYSLDSFTKMADDFKRKYFDMDPKLVPCEIVEKEFWRILSAGDNVVVNYGADNPANVCGSGFPISSSPENNEEYVKSSWNLNNLSILPTSTLRFIEEEVSGMKVPWCYVGMVFSCFSWHTEDHYSYSVNYMHWGEPKTWYGVGGADACKLEECMLHHVPELFKYSPDLMHQLTTLLSPSILMSFGVPITRTDQYPGDFIITFPRAYHAGFNQGINFAEAVNYCPADWIKLGRLSVIEYKNVKRACVFSLDELFCKMSLHLNELQIDLIRILLEDLQAVFNFESKMLERAELSGISKKEKLIFEDLCDDERVCCICQTTCFLHAVVCDCSGEFFSLSILLLMPLPIFNVYFRTVPNIITLNI